MERGDRKRLGGASSVHRADYEFLNTVVKVVALKDLPEMDLTGLRVGPFKEGEVYSVYYWVAEELDREGLVKISAESTLTLEQLEKLRWLQLSQKGGLLPLPHNFYPMARRLISASKGDAQNRAMKALQDIVSFRTAIITRAALSELARAPANLTPEEESLYSEVRKVISEHKRATVEGNP